MRLIAATLLALTFALPCYAQFDDDYGDLNDDGEHYHHHHKNKYDDDPELRRQRFRADVQQAVEDAMEQDRFNRGLDSFGRDDNRRSRSESVFPDPYWYMDGHN